MSPLIDFSFLQGISAWDIGVLVVVLICALRCAFQGFVREITGVAGIIVGVILGALLSGLVAPVFEQWLGKTAWNQVIAFVAIFLITLLIFAMLRSGLQGVIEGLELNTMDHFLGFIIGAIEGMVIVFLLFFLLDLQQVVPLHHELEKSGIFRLIAPLFAYGDQFLRENTGVLPSIQSTLSARP